MTFAAAPRFAASLPIGLLITVGLAALMQALIAQKVVTEDPPIAYEIDFAPIARPERPIVNVDDPPPRWTPPPEIPRTGGGIAIPRLDPVTPEDVGERFDPRVSRLPEGSQASSFIAQGPVLLFPPFVEYPQSMYPREGSCDVRYDITSAGATTNIQVASCTIQGFARFAERVVERAVYQPAQGEAGPVASAGHVMSVEFRLEE